jgi:hypothetical protein
MTAAHLSDAAPSSAVVKSDGSVCQPLEIPTPLPTDVAVGTMVCTCAYDLFSSEPAPICYPRQLSTWAYPGGFGPLGTTREEIPIGTLAFKPSLPPRLEIHAVSLTDFHISGTYPQLGRLIISEVAYDPLGEAGLQEQIALLSTLPGTVNERLADDDPDNDATVIHANGIDALVRFPQTPDTQSHPPIETVEWIVGDVRIAVVVQLGPQAELRDPTYDDSISSFIDAFVPIL